MYIHLDDVNPNEIMVLSRYNKNLEDLDIEGKYFVKFCCFIKSSQTVVGTDDGQSCIGWVNSH